MPGGTPDENAAIARALFAGDHGPARDIVVLNAGAGLYVAGRAADRSPTASRWPRERDRRRRPPTLTLDRLVAATDRRDRSLPRSITGLILRAVTDAAPGRRRPDRGSV